MKNLHKLKKTHYAEGADLALSNARGHLNAAKATAGIEEFGIGCSLLVISLEELAKASILKIKSINNQIQIRDLEKYFHHHKLKHSSIYKIFMASLDFQIEDEKGNNNSSQEYELAILAIIVFIGIAIYVYSKSSKDRKSQSDMSLEDIRKAGLYLGYDEEKKSWISPKDLFSKEDFKLFEDIVKCAFEVIESALFKRQMNTSSLIEFVNKLESENIIVDNLTDLKKGFN